MDLRAQELGSATKDSDGKRPAALLKLSARGTTGAQYDQRATRKLPAHNTTGRYTEAVDAQYDQRATRKLSARNTTGGASKNRATRGSATRKPAVLTQQVPGRRKVGAQYERRSAEEFEDGQNRADRTDAENRHLRR